MKTSIANHLSNAAEREFSNLVNAPSWHGHVSAAMQSREGGPTDSPMLPPDRSRVNHITVRSTPALSVIGGAPNQQTINPERNLAFANIGVARGPAYIEDMLDRALSHHGIARQAELENVFYAAVWGWLTTR